MRLWCFNDAHFWGRDLALEAKAQKHDARLFEDGREPDMGYAFMHLHHHPQTRARDKGINQQLALNPDIVAVPEYRSARLYDDKLEQAAELSKWMPRTRAFFSPRPVRQFLETSPDFPIISKTREGASSHNVRLLRTMDEANQEIRLAFSDLGIDCRYGHKQHGYLLWQKFCAGNKGDIRIIAIGDLRLVLKRNNRKDRPFASGSGSNTPVTVLDKSTMDAFTKADDFFVSENFKWCGIDLVYDYDDKRWVILETTVGWTLRGYDECQFIDRNGKPTGKTGRDIWKVFIKQLEQGVFG